MGVDNGPMQLWKTQGKARGLSVDRRQLQHVPIGGRKESEPHPRKLPLSLIHI